MTKFVQFATGNPASAIMIAPDDSHIIAEACHGLNPGDKVTKIGNISKGMAFAHREDIFKSYAIYKGTIECDYFFRDRMHKFMCFEVLDGIEIKSKRIFLLYCMYKEGEIDKLLVPDILNNNIRLYDPVFSIKL